MPTLTPTLTTREVRQSMIERFSACTDKVLQDTITHMAPAFRREAILALSEMRDALSRREGERLKLAACAMKGSCSKWGLLHLASLCGQVERLAQEDAFAAAALELRQVAAEYRQAQTVLDELVAGEQAP